MVSVGLAGVGHGNDLEKTARFINILQQSIGPEGMAKYINNTELIKRLSSSMGISRWVWLNQNSKLLQKCSKLSRQLCNKSWLQIPRVLHRLLRLCRT